MFASSTAETTGVITGLCKRLVDSCALHYLNAVRRISSIQGAQPARKKFEQVNDSA
jgi:hypothetical protein